MKKRNSILTAIVLGILTIDLAILISLTFKFDIIQNLVMSWIMTTIYAVVAFLMVDSPVVREKNNFIVQEVEIEKPVIHIVPDVQKEIEYITVDNPTVEVVEKPVEKRIYIEVPVEKKVYVEKKRKKLNIPKYKFIGSDETLTYHKTNCRFRKLIKRKNQVSKNTETYFKKNKFKKCKMCFGGKK